MSIFINLLSRRFDIAVNFNNSSPFSYAAVKSYTFQPNTKNFKERNSNIKNIWKVIVSTVAGELMSIFLLPVLWASSLKYQRT
jgi:hypothetical protein